VVLLDTHVLVWLSAGDRNRLSKNATTTIEDCRARGEGLAICDISLLELATLVNRGRLQLSGSLETFLRQIEEKFTILPIGGKACAQAVYLPESYPKDPADRIIGATALVNEMSLITADAAIRDSHAVPTIW